MVVQRIMILAITDLNTNALQWLTSILSKFGGTRQVDQGENKYLLSAVSVYFSMLIYMPHMKN